MSEIKKIRSMPPLTARLIKSAIIQLDDDTPSQSLLLGALKVARDTYQTQYNNAVLCKDKEMQVVIYKRIVYLDKMLKFEVVDVNIKEIRKLILDKILAETEPWPPETWQTDEEIEEYRNTFNEECAKYANANNEWWQLTKKNQPEPIQEDEPVKPSKVKTIINKLKRKKK